MAQSDVSSKKIDQAAFGMKTDKESKDSQQKIKKIIFTILPYIPVGFWSLVTLFPFLFMIIMATKTSPQIYTNPPPIYFGTDWWDNVKINYEHLLSLIPFWRNVWNSIYIAIMATVLTIGMASFGGYGFAMYDFKGKKVMFNLMVWTMAIPGVLTIIPYFSMMRALGWINKPRAVYLSALASAYGIYMMAQYTKSAISKDLLDAARIDGCSEIGIYWRVVVPLVRPMLGSLGIVTFLGTWNSFFLPLVVFTEKDAFTIPVALNAIRGVVSVDWGAVMLGSAIAVIPMGIIFLSLSRWIISGMTEGSVKE